MIIKHKQHKKIMAADEFDDFGFDEPAGPGPEEDALNDRLDDIGDDLDAMQDDLDEIEEEDTNIEIDNNIENHYIAECSKCKGVFISAMTLSTEPVTSITGQCPLCNDETEQELKWIVKSIDDIEDEEVM